MINLGTYLGHLLAEITKARAAADTEALRIATGYQQNELLKELPIPRFRLPDIKARVPVIVSGVQMENRTESLQPQPIAEAILLAITTTVPLFQLTINADHWKIIRAAVEARVYKEDVALANGIIKDTSAGELALLVTETMRKLRLLNPKIANAFNAKLTELTATQFAAIPKAPIGLLCEFNSVKIKELGVENCSILELSITEESLQWHTKENKEGKPVNFLVIE
jgi:hypothetical protein